MFWDELRAQVNREKQHRIETEERYSPMTDEIEEETGSAYCVSIEIRGKLTQATVIVTPVRGHEGNVIDFDAEIIDMTKEFVPADHQLDRLKELAVEDWKAANDW